MPPVATNNGNAGVRNGSNNVAGKPWFYGDIDRNQAVNILKARANVGEFLVRNCTVCK